MGLGESKWKERYVALDPTVGNLAYWDVNANASRKQLDVIVECQAPKREFDLADLIEIDTNENHNIFMLNFCRRGNRKQCGQGVTFQASCKEDFDRWVQVLSRYGMKESNIPTAARAA